MRKGALGASDPRAHYLLPDFFRQLAWCPQTKVGLHTGRMGVGCWVLGAGLVPTDEGGTIWWFAE